MSKRLAEVLFGVPSSPKCKCECKTWWDSRDRYHIKHHGVEVVQTRAMWAYGSGIPEEVEKASISKRHGGYATDTSNSEDDSEDETYSNNNETDYDEETDSSSESDSESECNDDLENSSDEDESTENEVEKPDVDENNNEIHT